MDTIKLLLAHADKRVANLIEVAVLDVCYDLVAVKSTRISHVDEFARQGSLWDFDLIVVGAENLYAERSQQTWARPETVIQAIGTIRAHSSAPIIAITPSAELQGALLEAGVHSVLGMPFNAERLKSELRPLLDLNGLAEPEETNRWSSLGSLFKGVQKVRVGD